MLVVVSLHAAFDAYRVAAEAELEAVVARALKNTAQNRGAARAAVIRRAEAEVILDQATREADREITRCRATHVEMIAPGVFGLDLRREG